MWFVAAVVVVAGWMAFRWKTFADAKTGEVQVPVAVLALSKSFGIALVVAFALTFLTDAIVIVPPGYRGVVFDVTRGVRPVALTEGFNVVIPFIQEVTLMDTRLQNFETDATAASKDLQIIHAKVAVNFYPIREEIASLYQQVGPQYGEKIVAPAVMEVIKASAARYTAEELIAKREKVKDDIHAGLVKALARAHIKIVETFITDFDFSEEFSRAIESKQVAEQQALRAERELVKVKIEAEQKIATARAEAEGLRMQREAVSGNLVELRRIEMQLLAIGRWDGVLPKMLLGNSPAILDVSKYTK